VLHKLVAGLNPEVFPLLYDKPAYYHDNAELYRYHAQLSIIGKTLFVPYVEDMQKASLEYIDLLKQSADYDPTILAHIHKQAIERFEEEHCNLQLFTADCVDIAFSQLDGEQGNSEQQGSLIGVSDSIVCSIQLQKVDEGDTYTLTVRDIMTGERLFSLTDNHEHCASVMILLSVGYTTLPADEVATLIATSYMDKEKPNVEPNKKDQGGKSL